MRSDEYLEKWDPARAASNAEGKRREVGGRGYERGERDRQRKTDREGQKGEGQKGARERDETVGETVGENRSIHSLILCTPLI